MKKDLTFYTKVSQNLLAIHHLKHLLIHLQKDGPEILFFRGISLLGDVYPSMGERGMIDADILVREKDLRRLKKVLQGMGMEETEPGNFSKPGLFLDVHTSFLNPSRTILEHSCLRISIEDVFRRSVTKDVDGMEIKVPCPVHLFITTAIHLQSHSFRWENGWEDLKRIREYYDLSDAEIGSEARKMRAANILIYLGFLRPELFLAWKGRLSLAEQWILRRIRAGTYNQNFGDLLFLFHSKRRVRALQEIFFPHGISLSSIVDRLKKTFLLLRAILA